MVKWRVTLSGKVQKQLKKLPESVRMATFLLISDLGLHGPSTSGIWKNYGKLKGLKGDRRHCHLSKGKPTYVCCWEVLDKQLHLVEIYYVGTHEKAPY